MDDLINYNKLKEISQKIIKVREDKSLENKSIKFNRNDLKITHTIDKSILIICLVNNIHVYETHANNIIEFFLPKKP